MNKIESIANKNENKQPSNLEAEQALLGSILVNNDIIDEISNFIYPQTFYDPSHIKIFEVIESLNNKGMIANPITLKNFFEKDNMLKEVGGTEYLVKLTRFSGSAKQAVDYAKVIHEMYLRRELVQISDKLSSDTLNANSQEQNAETIIESTEKLLFDLAERGSFSQSFLKFNQALDQTIEMATLAMKNEKGIVGVPTGLTDLDEKLGGLHKSDLIIIAGRPSMGKTALGTNIAFNCAIKYLEEKDEFQNKKIVDGGKVAFFSLEMSSEQLATRILAEQTKISGDKMRKAELNKQDFNKIAKTSSELENLNLIIDDNPVLTIPTLRSRARRLKRLHDINLIIIDYLQLMSSSSNNRNDGRVQEISEITRGLKSIAKELNIPVVALSQLSRQVEQREDKRPQLSDLRESGTIEQDSDVVMFIYRESYYLERLEPIRKSEEDDMKYNERVSRWQQLTNENYNKAEIIIAKQRHGPIGSIKMHFDANYTKFSDLTSKDYDNIIE